MERSSIKTAALLATAALVIGSGALPARTQSESEKPASDPAFRAVVRELVRVTGALELGAQLADAALQGMLASMRASGREISPEAVEVLRETSREYFGEVFGDEDEIVRVLSRIYAQHFTRSELSELLAFYRTPVGAKAIRATPLIAQETLVWGQARAMERLGAFEAELDERLKAAGL